MNSIGENITEYKIYVKTALDSGSTTGFSFIDTNGNYVGNPPNDFYVTCFLQKDVSFDYYVQVDKDPSIFQMSRQEFNPFFIEFSFYDSIQRNQITDGSTLTLIQINFLRSTVPDIANFTDSQIITWFNNVGRYSQTIDISQLETLSLNDADIISKANMFNITINS